MFHVQGEAVQEDPEELRSFATPDTTRLVTHRHISDATPMTELRVTHSSYDLQHLNYLGKNELCTVRSEGLPVQFCWSISICKSPFNISPINCRIHPLNKFKNLKKKRINPDSQRLTRRGDCPSSRLSQVIYRVIRKSLQDFRTRLRNNQDRHGRKEHINR